MRGTQADAPRTWLAQCEQTSTLACRIRPTNNIPPVLTARATGTRADTLAQTNCVEKAGKKDMPGREEVGLNRTRVGTKGPPFMLQPAIVVVAGTLNFHVGFVQ